MHEIKVTIKTSRRLTEDEFHELSQGINDSLEEINDLEMERDQTGDYESMMWNVVMEQKPPGVGA